MDPKYHFIISFIAAYFISIQLSGSTVLYFGLFPVGSETPLEVFLGTFAGVLIDVDHFVYPFTRNRHLAWEYLSKLRLRLFYRLMRLSVSNYLVLHGFFILLSCFTLSFLFPLDVTVIYSCLIIHFLCDIGSVVFNVFR